MGTPGERAVHVHRGERLVPAGAQYVAPAREPGVYVDVCSQELRGGCVHRCTRSQGIKEQGCDPWAVLPPCWMRRRGWRSRKGHTFTYAAGNACLEQGRDLSWLGQSSQGLRGGERTSFRGTEESH